MEQKDYLLREVEKIGILLKALIDRLIGSNENLAISIDDRFDETKGMLLNEINFDVDKFVHLNDSEAIAYLSGFDGLNLKNIELLADVFSQIGFGNGKKEYIKKALQLYEHCNRKDKTFSMERENKIAAIKNTLE